MGTRSRIGRCRRVVAARRSSHQATDFPVDVSPHVRGDGRPAVEGGDDPRGQLISQNDLNAGHVFRLNPPDKQQARELARTCRKVTGASAVATAGSSLSAASGGTMSFAVLALGALIGAAATSLGQTLDEVANDPPRKDFTSRTDIKALRIDIESLVRRGYRRRLDTEGRPLGSLVEERLADVSRGMFDSGAYLDAMLRAYERAAGALEAEDEEKTAFVPVKPRLEPTQKSRLACLSFSADRAEALAAALDDDGDLRVSASEPGIIAQLSALPGRSLDQFLPDRSLAMLYVAGVRIDRAAEQSWAGRVAIEDGWRVIFEFEPGTRRERRATSPRVSEGGNRLKARTPEWA